MISILNTDILLALGHGAQSTNALGSMIEKAKTRGPGNGVAVYMNAELGNPNLGHVQFASFGPSEFNMLVGPVAPERLPDIGSSIGWRYLLRGTWTYDV